MPVSEPLKPCCAEFAMATRKGTDNEMYGALAWNLGGEWHMGTDVPGLRFCPWCGVGINGCSRAPSPVVAEVVKEMRRVHAEEMAGECDDYIERWASRLERAE